METEVNLQAIVETGANLLEEAGGLLLSLFRKVSASEKSDGSLVTQADREADAWISAALKKRFPAFGILSEEQETRYQGEEFCWILDPLDGTTNFALGLPTWGISLALLHKGEPLACVLHFPVLQELYWAVRGGGAYQGRNGPPLKTLPDSELSKSQFVGCCSRTILRYKIQFPCKPRILGSAVYNFVLVGRGIFAGSIEATPKLWDVAGGSLLVQEAGGAISLLEGKPAFPIPSEKKDYKAIDFPSLSAGNDHLWRKVKEGLRGR